VNRRRREKERGESRGRK